MRGSKLATLKEKILNTIKSKQDVIQKKLSKIEYSQREYEDILDMIQYLDVSSKEMAQRKLNLYEWLQSNNIDISNTPYHLGKLPLDQIVQILVEKNSMDPTDSIYKSLEAGYIPEIIANFYGKPNMGDPSKRVVQFSDRQLESMQLDIVGENILYQGKKANFKHCIFAYTDRGLFVAKKKSQVSGEVHHSSLASEGKVLAAGALSIKNGKLTMINNHSGHYKPTETHLNNAVEFFAPAMAHDISIRVITNEHGDYKEYSYGDWQEKFPFSKKNMDRKSDKRISLYSSQNTHDSYSIPNIGAQGILSKLSPSKQQVVQADHQEVSSKGKKEKLSKKSSVKKRKDRYRSTSSKEKSDSPSKMHTDKKTKIRKPSHVRSSFSMFGGLDSAGDDFLSTKSTRKKTVKKTNIMSRFSKTSSKRKKNSDRKVSSREEYSSSDDNSIVQSTTRKRFTHGKRLASLFAKLPNTVNANSLETAPTIQSSSVVDNKSAVRRGIRKEANKKQSFTNLFANEFSNNPTIDNNIPPLSLSFPTSPRSDFRLSGVWSNMQSPSQSSADSFAPSTSKATNTKLEANNIDEGTLEVSRNFALIKPDQSCFSSPVSSSANRKPKNNISPVGNFTSIEKQRRESQKDSSQSSTPFSSI